MKLKRHTRQKLKSEKNKDDLKEEPSVTVPVIEEKLNIAKKIVETGKVRITKKVTEEDVNVNVPVIHEEYEIERVAVNRYVNTPPQVHYEGDTMIIPVVKEVVVKQLVLAEELHIRRKEVETISPQQATLRREQVIVEREKHIDPGQGEENSRMNER